MSKKEFLEVAHSGGITTYKFRIDQDGNKELMLGFKHSRPNVKPSLVGLFVLPSGHPVGMMNNPIPHSSCYPIYISSDSEGKFGHRCPSCNGYWRSECLSSRHKMFCPYCRFESESYVFITDGQNKYIETVTRLINRSLYNLTEREGVFDIDMDNIVDQVSKGICKPEFYYAEESQQNKFNCEVCGSYNDILGRYGFCSKCGKHNGLKELKDELEKIKENCIEGQYANCLRQVVSEFDSC